jgi:hypothetical protein
MKQTLAHWPLYTLKVLFTRFVSLLERIGAPMRSMVVTSVWRHMLWCQWYPNFSELMQCGCWAPPFWLFSAQSRYAHHQNTYKAQFQNMLSSLMPICLMSTERLQNSPRTSVWQGLYTGVQCSCTRTLANCSCIMACTIAVCRARYYKSSSLVPPRAWQQASQSDNSG